MKWIKKIFDRSKSPEEVPVEVEPDPETIQVQGVLKLSDEAMAQLFPKEAVMITAVFETENAPEPASGNEAEKSPAERKGWVDPLSGHPIV